MSEPFYWASKDAWYINYMDNGKRRRKLLGKTEREARRKFKDWLRTGEQQALGKVRFDTLAAAWLARQLARLKRGEVSKEWLARCNRTIGAFNAARPGIMCHEITEPTATDWLPKGSSAAYERTEAGVLRQILRWGHNTGQLRSNPLAGMRLDKGARREGCVDATMHKALVRAARDSGFKRLLWFCWWTGCRPIEIRHLRWEQISPDCSVATLLQHKNAKKTGRPRVIYFVPEAQRVLASMRQAKGHVFINRMGNPWTKDAIVKRMGNLQKRTGLKLTAYAYRHGYATRALEQGVSAADVAELLGTSIEVISRNYAHLDRGTERLMNAAKRVK